MVVLQVLVEVTHRAGHQVQVLLVQQEVPVELAQSLMPVELLD